MFVQSVLSFAVGTVATLYAMIPISFGALTTGWIFGMMGGVIYSVTIGTKWKN